MKIPDPGLEAVGDELLEGEYELDVATDPRAPSIPWEQGDEKAIARENSGRHRQGTVLESK